MTKRGLALAAAGVIALSGGGLQAQATGTAIDAVTVAWVGEQVRISWTETAPVANTIRLSTGKELGSTTADEADQLLVPRSAFGTSSDPADAVTVQVTDPAGMAATSAPFDRYVPRQPNVVLTLDAEEAVHWSVRAAGVDATPGDPLDVAEPATYDAKLREQAPQGSCTVVQLASSTATSGVVPRRSNPYRVEVRASNEWGTDPAPDPAVGHVRTADAGLTVPTGVPYGTGGLFRLWYSTLGVGGSDASGCTTWRESGGGTGPLKLESRDSATGPWTAVRTVSPDGWGQYPTTVLSQGTREYRVVRDTVRTGESQIVYGDVSEPKQVRSVTRVVDAKFITPVIPLGTQPQAYLRVDPEGSQQAALQWKNTSGVWQGISFKTLSSGRGLLTFPFNRRGTAEFRWWTPGSTLPSGLTVDPVYSQVFTLTVT